MPWERRGAPRNHTSRIEPQGNGECNIWNIPISKVGNFQPKCICSLMIPGREQTSRSSPFCLNDKSMSPISIIIKAIVQLGFPRSMFPLHPLSNSIYHQIAIYHIFLSHFHPCNECLPLLLMASTCSPFILHIGVVSSLLVYVPNHLKLAFHHFLLSQQPLHFI